MTLQFTEREVKAEMARLSKGYDIVRLVDPEECHAFSVGADHSCKYGEGCYSVWRSTNRCRNCTSLRALKTGMELHKTEIKDGDLYFITSRPIEILRADGTTFSCIMELIRIERGKGMKKDGHRAVLQEGFDKRAFAETLRVAMQNLPTGVVWFDRKRHCIYANSEAFRIFDVPDSLAKLEVILKDWFQEDALSSPEATVWLQQYREKESPRSLQICRYPLNDGTGKDVGMYFLISDCTQDQKNLDLEHFGTMHDALTGIYNKYGFYRQARRVMDDNPHVAIDDFGSGYSSLSFLKDIQADILKIDMEFLRKTEHQGRSRIILRSIVALARELGMPTVVEGVETSQQVRDLTQIGCDIFQGFYYSRPVPVADFEERFPDGLARPWSEPVQAEK